MKKTYQYPIVQEINLQAMFALCEISGDEIQNSGDSMFGGNAPARTLYM